MSSIGKLIKKGCFCEAYKMLGNTDRISVEWIDKELKGVNNKSIVLFIVYLISLEKTTNNVLLLCEYLIYMDPPFEDIHPVINFFLRMKIKDDDNAELLKWIICTYESHPDSPFLESEIREFKEVLSKNK